MLGWLRTLSLAIVVALTFVVGLGPTVAEAEIFKWTDASGQIHFAQDLHQVPARYRKQAEANANRPSTGPERVQTYESPASIAPARPSASRSGTTGKSGRTYKIPVERAGNMLRVVVRINNVVNAPFYIDTGASDVSVPRWVIERAGIDLSEARTGRYGTANGTIEVPLVNLESVELGGARVEGVPAAVSDTMQVGLLGLSYFNHFQYHVDPARGMVTLVENGLADEGLIRGGRSEPQWRSEFVQIRQRIEAAERDKESTPRSHGREHERLQGVIDELERQLEVLEGEADDAHVPFRWRD